MEFTTLETGEGKNASDHLVEFADFHFHTIVRAGLDGFLFAAGKSQCHAHAGEGRAQLMRDVAEEPPLAVDEIANATGHAVEVAYEVGNFVSATAEFSASPGIQITFSQGMRSTTQAGDRAREVKREQEAGYARHPGADDDQPQQT